MPVKLTDSQKHLMSIIRDARKTLKNSVGPLPYVGSNTLRTWGAGYVKSLLSAVIDDTIPSFSECGWYQNSGQPFENKLESCDQFNLVWVSHVLRFWSRMADRTESAQNRGSAEAHFRIRSLNLMIRGLDSHGWRPADMVSVISAVTGLSTRECQQILVIKAVENRSANEEAVVAECDKLRTLYPYERLQQYDRFFHRSNAPVIACDAPKAQVSAMAVVEKAIAQPLAA